MWVGIIQPKGDPNKAKRWRKGEFPPLFLRWDVHLLLPSDIGIPGSWVFGLQDLYQWLPGFSGLWTWTELYQHLAFLVFEFADGRSCNFLASITMSANSYNKSHIYIHKS